MEKRIAKWDNLKGFLIALVVIGHFVEPFVEYSDKYKMIWTAIYFIHMPLMVFLAGLFIKSTVSNKERVGRKMLYYMKLYVIYEEQI